MCVFIYMYTSVRVILNLLHKRQGRRDIALSIGTGISGIVMSIKIDTTQATFSDLSPPSGFEQKKKTQEKKHNFSKKKSTF